MARLIIQNRPIKHEIVLIALAEEQVFEKAAQVGVVGAVLEAQAAAVVEVRHELGGKVFAQDLDRCRHLLLHDLLVLLLLGVGLKALPWQAAAVEVHQHVPHRLQVVTPALLDAEVRVHARVPGSACQVLALAVRDMLLGLGVPVLFGKPEIDDVHLVCLLAQADEEVVGLDVAMDEVLGVDVLHAVDHLVREHQDRLQAELPVAETE
mmetsp:Transcript_66791/g.173749  ORF Transcript_66791/g.173749 Transcript_66791/m.173749 type:complete len:208 (-) Transcript_66791:54-677(-)